MVKAKVMPPVINATIHTQSVEVDNSRVKLVKGDIGPVGPVFTPFVDIESNLSWTNNGGLENPPTRNIRGATGESGVSAISNFDIERIMEV